MEREGTEASTERQEAKWGQCRTSAPLPALPACMSSAQLHHYHAFVMSDVMSWPSLFIKPCKQSCYRLYFKKEIHLITVNGQYNCKMWSHNKMPCIQNCKKLFLSSRCGQRLVSSQNEKILQFCKSVDKEKMNKSFFTVCNLIFCCTKDKWLCGFQWDIWTFTQRVSAGCSVHGSECRADFSLFKAAKVWNHDNLIIYDPGHFSLLYSLFVSFTLVDYWGAKHLYIFPRLIKCTIFHL